MAGLGGSGAAFGGPGLQSVRDERVWGVRVPRLGCGDGRLYQSQPPTDIIERWDSVKEV